MKIGMKWYGMVVLLIIHIGVLGYAIYIGPRGIAVCRALHNDFTHACEQTKKLEITLAEKKQELDLWKHEPFFTERVAREQLQMSRPDDVVYFINR